MKRLFTLLMALAVTGVVSLQAQVLQQSRISQPEAQARGIVKKATIEPQDNQAWWGYVTSDAYLSGLGVSAPDTYHCAIFIPGNDPTAAGKTLKAIRFAMYATNVSNIKVWVANSLPSSISGKTVLEYVDVATAEAQGIVDVALPKAVPLPSSGIYVGYSFTITQLGNQDDSYPIAITPDDDAPNTLLIKTDAKVPSWSDLNGQEFGRLFLQVLLEGDFPQHSATPLALSQQIVKLGSTATAQLPVVGTGTMPIADIDYTITTDGVTGNEQHAEVAVPIIFGATGTVAINIEADSEKGLRQKSITITKVNGHPNETAQATATFEVVTVAEVARHRVAVEEYTGTGCGWCPRGIIGMEKLRARFGDDFVGIAIHQYNTSDAMFIATNAYARLGFSGAPSCAIDRKYITDPYYGEGDDIADDFLAEQAIPALAAIEVEGLWNEDSTAVDATAKVTALLDGMSFRVEFVLIADSLQGTDSAWNQSNYYSQYAASQLPGDLAQFGSGGAYGRSAVTGWKFNDVAISSSYVNGSNRTDALNNLPSDEPATVSYTLSLPTKATLRNALKKDYIYVAALVINTDGTVVNAIKARVTGDDSTITGISTPVPSAANGQSVGHFSLDGRQLTAPQRGLNIVRMADGTTRKVLVK